MRCLCIGKLKPSGCHSLSSPTLAVGKVSGSSLPANVGFSMNPFRKLSRKSDPESNSILKTKQIFRVWERTQLSHMRYFHFIAKHRNLYMMPEYKVIQVKLDCLSLLTVGVAGGARIEPRNAGRALSTLSKCSTCHWTRSPALFSFVNEVN